MLVQKYSILDVIFSLHYNKLESEKHFKLRFFTAPTSSAIGVSSNMGWGVNSVGCTRYFVGLIWTVEHPPSYLFFVRTDPTWTYFEK